MIDKRRPRAPWMSSIDVRRNRRTRNRESIQRLEDRVSKLRGFETRVKGLLAQIRRALNLLELRNHPPRERNGR